MTLPGFHTCRPCGGIGNTFDRAKAQPGFTGPLVACPECGGAGQVPDDDTVEALAKTFYTDQGSADDAWEDEVTWGSHADYWRGKARAALLAYARHTQETKP